MEFGLAQAGQSPTQPCPLTASGQPIDNLSPCNPTASVHDQDGIETMNQVKRYWCYRGGSVESGCGLRPEQSSPQTCASSLRKGSHSTAYHPVTRQSAYMTRMASQRWCWSKHAVRNRSLRQAMTRMASQRWGRSNGAGVSVAGSVESGCGYGM